MFTLTKRVLPQHTDYAGVMWHGAYVQWLEEARVEALQAAGLGYAAMTAMGVDMPVVSLHLDYRQPLRHGDEVCVESRCPGQQGGLRVLMWDPGMKPRRPSTRTKAPPRLVANTSE